MHTILNVKRSIRSIVLGEAVTRLPSDRSLRSSLAWHRHRIAELSAQLDLAHVRGNPRRHCELVLQIEHHDEMVRLLTANLGRPRPTPPSPKDRAMSADWRNQLDAVKVALSVA
jgi:hypothetical protein